MPCDALFTTSWDDGHPSDLRIAELLSKYHIKGTFYIPAASNKTVLNRNQIRDLSSEFELGAHTIHHQVLTECPDSAASYEIIDSKEFISDITGDPCDIFCFPKGKFKRRHLLMAKNAGYKAVRTVEILNNRGAVKRECLWVLPTTMQVYPHTRIEYTRNIIKRYSWNNAKNLSKIIPNRWLDSAKNLFIQTQKNGGVFHLWGHSWEIDELNLWMDLEKFFIFVNSNQQNVKFMENSKLYPIDL